MERDKVIGIIMVIAGITISLFYAVALFMPNLIFEGIDVILVKITVFIAVVAVMGILAWIGYTLATTPPPKPIEEIEKELEKELKELEKELEAEKKEEATKEVEKKEGE